MIIKLKPKQKRKDSINKYTNGDKAYNFRIRDGFQIEKYKQFLEVLREADKQGEEIAIVRLQKHKYNRLMAAIEGVMQS